MGVGEQISMSADWPLIGHLVSLQASDWSLRSHGVFHRNLIPAPQDFRRCWTIYSSIFPQKFPKRRDTKWFRMSKPCPVTLLQVVKVWNFNGSKYFQLSRTELSHPKTFRININSPFSATASQWLAKAAALGKLLYFARSNSGRTMPSLRFTAW